MTRHGRLDDIHTCAVVVGGTQQMGHTHDDHSAHKNAYIGVFQIFARPALRKVQTAAEQDTDECTQKRQNHHQQHGPCVQRRHHHGKACGRDVHQSAHKIAHHGGGDTGNQARVVQHAHADDLQGKHGGCQRCAEQGGKHAAHAAQSRQRQVLFMQMQQRSCFVADPAADLQRRALTARAAAEKMCDHGGNKDQRHQDDRHFLAEMHRLNNGVGTFPLHLRAAVQQHLRSHPSVKSYRLGKYGEGEDGVTIVELK